MWKIFGSEPSRRTDAQVELSTTLMCCVGRRVGIGKSIRPTSTTITLFVNSTILPVDSSFTRFLINKIYNTKMKFSSAVVVAVMASSVQGFVVPTSSSSKNVILSMSTETPTKTYTFTKSEEIFAEAQTVRYIVWCNLVLQCCPILLTHLYCNSDNAIFCCS